jgi:hypothetical protein
MTHLQQKFLDKLPPLQLGGRNSYRQPMLTCINIEPEEWRETASMLEYRSTTIRSG